MAMRKLADIPELPRYITVAQAAKILGMTKTSVYYRIYDKDAFDQVYRIGGDISEGPRSKNDERPLILLLRTEVEEMVKKDQAKANYKPFEQLLNEWNRRVKQWGVQTAFDNGRINTKGRPSNALITAYLAANPDDPRPE